MKVCVDGDLAGGTMRVHVATRVGSRRVVVRGDRVNSHAPCPVPATHCSAVMTTTVSTNIDGVPIVIEGDPATCGHLAVSRTEVTITPTPVDADVRPDAPGAPTVTAVPLALEVSWGTVRLAETYKVQWKSGDETYGPSRQASVEGTEYTIRDLEADVAVTVRVIATRESAGDGPPSAEVTGTPLHDGATLTAPGASFSAVPGFLAIWSGSFGLLPAAWFVDPENADRNLRTVRINAPVLGGTVVIDVGRGGHDLLEDVRGSLTLTITTDYGSFIATGIGGGDRHEPYEWVPSNSDEAQALLAAISRRRAVAATFSFVRG